jgi:hypothetical protein
MSLTVRLIKLSLGPVVALSFALTAGCSTSSANESGSSSRPAIGGDIADEQEADFEQELKSKTDAQVTAEIAPAAVGANYTSESDYGFKFVSAKLSGQTSMTQALVREKVGAFVDADPDTDKPLASLYASTSTFKEWRANTANCQPDEAPSPEDCATINKMNAVLEKNLRGIKVFYFGRDGSRGHVDGVAVSVIIVGRTPAGNLAGLRTIAIWT